MRIYTRQGDRGETHLADGSKVSKDHPAIVLNGHIDKAVSVLGAARSTAPEVLKEEIKALQEMLMSLMAFVARGSKEYELPGVESLESKIDSIQERYPFDCYSKVLDVFNKGKFVVPGESLCESLLHVARTVVREAERYALQAAKKQALDERLVPFLNRLSDYICVLAIAAVFEDFVSRITQIVMRELAKYGNFNLNKTGGGAGTMYSKGMNLDLALKFVDAATKRASEIGVPMVIAVVDESGVLTAYSRMDGALLVSCDLAIKKAKTAVSLRMPTDKVAELVQPGKPLYGLQSDSNLCCFGGGFPIKKDGKVIGAIGVSGGSVEEDMDVAQYALSVSSAF
ncbi:ATP/cobalamin adenosyltransferase [Thermovirga lienii DSM 17291]|uniref:ATP/cobalamin adenosyltransferase n=1 Tax=Thermovirga lienii (strain ATCC BAA-1197 / DSM 17291 / Cas60314) TaxID=580340 RepID=G7V6C3_THELD|nr:cob(I)yrinic acid a,c-diamide adenosyltransferase [Thermovirga lienii]AER65952.1 ATP/cobalamin adenosyltransferase [Thermovirga lienii DSM 17291]